MAYPPVCETPGDDLASLCSASSEFLLGFQTFTVASDLTGSFSPLQASSCESSFIPRGTATGVHTPCETPLEALLPGPTLQSPTFEGDHTFARGDTTFPHGEKNHPCKSVSRKTATDVNAAPGTTDSVDDRPSSATAAVRGASPPSTIHCASSSAEKLSEQKTDEKSGFARIRGAQKNGLPCGGDTHLCLQATTETTTRRTQGSASEPAGAHAQGREEEEAGYRQVVTRFQFLKQLRHPHLCVYTHILRRADRFFVVSEYWSLSLADLIYQREQARTPSPSTRCDTSFLEAVALLPEAFLRRMASQVLSALAFLNEQGLTHGRLCPSTIRFTSSGDVRLSDWGLAHLSRQGHLAPHTRLAPSPPFLTPQQALFGSSYATRMPPFSKDDTWALGAVLLQAAQGPPRLLPGVLLALLAHAAEEQRTREAAQRREAEARLSRVRQGGVAGAAREGAFHIESLTCAERLGTAMKNSGNQLEAERRESKGTQDGETDVRTWETKWEREVEGLLGIKWASGPWDDWAGCERRIRGEGSWRLASQNLEEEELLPRLHPLRTLRAVEHAAMMLLYVHWAYEDRMRPHFERMLTSLSKEDAGESREKYRFSDARTKSRQTASTPQITPSFSCIGRGMTRRLLDQKEKLVEELRQVVSKPCCLVEPEAYASLLSLLSTCLERRESAREKEAHADGAGEGEHGQVKQTEGQAKRVSLLCHASAASSQVPAFDDSTFLWAVLCSHVGWFAGTSLFPSSFSSLLLHASSLPGYHHGGCGASADASSAVDLPSEASFGAPLSPGFREFLRRILEVNPDRRLTPAEALNLAWVHELPASVHAPGPLVARRSPAAGLSPTTGEGRSQREERNPGEMCTREHCGSKSEETGTHGRLCDTKRCERDDGAETRAVASLRKSKEILMCPQTAEAAQLLLDLHIDEELERTNNNSRHSRGCASVRSSDNLKDYLWRHHNVPLEEIFFWWQLRGGDVHTTLVDLGALRPVPPILRLPLCCLLRHQSPSSSSGSFSAHAFSAVRHLNDYERAGELSVPSSSSLCPSSVSSSVPVSTRLSQGRDAAPQRRLPHFQETPESSSSVSVSSPSPPPDACAAGHKELDEGASRARSSLYERLSFLSPLVDFRLLHDQAPSSEKTNTENCPRACLCNSLPSLLASCSCSSSRRDSRNGGSSSQKRQGNTKERDARQEGGREHIEREGAESEEREEGERSETRDGTKKGDDVRSDALGCSPSARPPLSLKPRHPAGISRDEAWGRGGAQRSGPQRSAAREGGALDDETERREEGFMQTVVEDRSFFACGFSSGRNWLEVEMNWVEGDARIRGVSIQDTVAALQEADRFSVSQMQEVRPRCQYMRQFHFLYQRLRVRLFRSLLVQLPKSLKRLTDEAAVDIPPLLRPQIWATLLGVNFAAEVAAGPFVFEQLVLESLASPADRLLANDDFSQCYEHHDLLGSRYGRRQLRCLLQALFAQNSGRSSSSLYPVPASPSSLSSCRFFSARGLDAIAAPLQLLYMNHPQIALACLDRLLTRQGQYKLFGCDNAAAIEEQLACFSQLLCFFDPLLAVHLQRIGLGPDLYALSWLLTLFAHALDLPQLFLLWDFLLVHPPSFLLFVCVCLLHHIRLPLLRLEPDEESSALSLLRAASAYLHVPALCGVASALEKETPVSVTLPFLARKSGLFTREGIEADEGEKNDEQQQRRRTRRAQKSFPGGASEQVPAPAEEEAEPEKGSGREDPEGDEGQDADSSSIQEVHGFSQIGTQTDEENAQTATRKQDASPREDLAASALGAVRFYIGDDLDEEREKRSASSAGHGTWRSPSLEQRLRARLLGGAMSSESREDAKKQKKKKQSLVAAMIQGPANLLMGPPRKPRRKFVADDEEDSDSVARGTALPG
ncbi:TBC domain-containing kinase (incomplete catalytic triad) [Toxoplasma gondii ME49]|uniref:non-specific serine/threonine protein kinase n=3 Tax=Toxoplasma gondii TaxID=5811 RepID=A0A125YVW3_TOXGV|nr:TBC domain-containing kinase (incomplete catalytic triad) [Toxoplasma gondii ME49]EPT25174.1 TBC domain-containing kinase (incomplete catalytic triad) [Toxoplasma gondii ME49]ESS34512.1 TBC domain-containing kinase (incomplete catalytic triad) [Toxoplasma gondii VEG]KYF50203.1 TBC domain-containing kinase (incomplete catalytic triad) [Toxoplasma gondii ARI]|eukprot:XP_018635070.1 TBC domain-containing kinase (incomplete catalytic triad) [Toxoplasma gondii ME49]